MPKIEPKQIQRELDEGQIWPVYWIYGQERMKSRELLKRIRTAALGSEAGANRLGLGEESFDAGETDSGAILDAAQSLSLGGGLRLIVVRDAHLLKGPEILSQLFGPKAAKEELTSVCVFLSKDLDGRKKFSKSLISSAAVVPCEEVAESEREPWIGYLSKRRGFTLGPEETLALSTLDPWSLDIVDQELEKYSLSILGSGEAGSAREVLLGGGAPGALHSGERFLDAFFRRSLSGALPEVDRFASLPEEALPLLGLFAWNARQLSILIADREQGTRNSKLNPHFADRFREWSKLWTLSDAIELQKELASLDFGFKQTPLLPLGMWSAIVLRFCR